MPREYAQTQVYMKCRLLVLILGYDKWWLMIVWLVLIVLLFSTSFCLQTEIHPWLGGGAADAPCLLPNLSMALMSFTFLIVVVAVTQRQNLSAALHTWQDQAHMVFLVAIKFCKKEKNKTAILVSASSAVSASANLWHWFRLIIIGF